MLILLSFLADDTVLWWAIFPSAHRYTLSIPENVTKTYIYHISCDRFC